MFKIKTIILSVIFISVISILSVSALSYNTYYECPSNMSYLPINHNIFIEACGEIKDTICESEEKAYKEYKSGKCKVSNQKYIKGTYNNTTCSIDFELSSKQQIIAHGYSGGNETDGAKCIDNLYKSLKSAYPNIKYLR